jgi:hypothetical protein
MFGPIHDRIGRSLIVLFLIKPSIDLGYFLSMSVGSIRLAPTTVAGFIICLYFAVFRFQGGRALPPYIRVFEAFIATNMVSILLGLTISNHASFASTLILMLKLMNSYVLFYAAYSAAVRYQYQDVTPFVRAIVVGSSVAVVLNLAAIGLDIESPAMDYAKNVGDRERGLYYDPGVLANLAFFNLIFAVFWLHMQKRKTLLWLLFIGFLLLSDLYLIAASKSRSVIIELAVFGVIYTWLFQRRFGRILAPLVGAAIIATSALVFDIDFDQVLVRFEGDIAAIGEEGPGVGTGSGGVTLGKFEALGSNRGALWADALTEIFSRTGFVLLLGDYYSSISLAHSDFVDVLGRNGIVGLAIYLTLLCGLLLSAFAATKARQADRDRALRSVAFILLVCYILYSVPFRPLVYTTSAWYMWVMLALSLANVAVVQGRHAQSRQDRRREPAASASREARGPAGAATSPR